MIDRPTGSGVNPLLRWELALLALAIVAGVALRFANLDRKIYWFNEVFTSIDAAAQDEQRDINPAIYNALPLAPADLQTFMQPKQGSTMLDVLRHLIQKDPASQPLYFVLARVWLDLFGSQPATVRSISALAGLLTIPALGLLCRELYRDWRVAGTGAALLALSPFFVRYSQEARPYMLMVLFLLLAHTAFLRALRLRTPASFVIYGALLVLGALTQILVVLAFAAHAIYLLASPEHRARPVRRAYILTVLAAAAFCAPWFLFALRNLRTVLATTAHLGTGFTLQDSLLLTGRNISYLLFAWETWADPLLLPLAPVVLGLVAYGCYLLLRDTPQRIWLFVLIQVGLPLLALVIPDLLRGGRAAVTDRYFTTVYVAVALGLAYLFSRPGLWRAARTVVLVGGFVSSTLAVQSSDWWGLSQVDIDIMNVMNNSAPNLLLSQVNYGVVAPLSYGLDPADRIILTHEDALPVLPPGFNHIYVYQPSPEFRGALSAHPGITLTKVYEQARWEGTVYSLYELRRSGP